MSSQPAQEIRFCKSSDGARIAYATCGAGPTLVKAGNWVTHLELDWNNPIWRPWLALLTRRHRLIRYDLRGCGLSDREVGNLSFDRLVDDIDAVIEAVNPGRLSLLGIAGGCAIAAAYAVRRPDRVDRLVLYGGFTRGAVARSVNAEQHEEAQTLLRLIELGGRKDDPAFRQLFTAQFIPDATPEQSHAFNDLMRVSGSTREAARVLRVLHEVDVRAIAARVRCPTMVLHPTHNFRVPFEEGRALAALIPKARFVPLQSRNFIVLEQETAWSQFASELEGFLAASGAATSRDPDLEVEHLTSREREVLELVAQGLDNSRIAKRLGISEKTVRNHVSTILGKLGLQSRLQAIVRAREGGFGHKRT
jgi:pimeloyl-ACP methyl ester carboxylesterase/DNA-binding CsgD family transcriptional regulator